MPRKTTTTTTISKTQATRLAKVAAARMRETGCREIDAVQHAFAMDGNLPMNDETVHTVETAMVNLPTTTTKKRETPCATFAKARSFIADFAALDDEQLDVMALWAMGTWTFSPMSPSQPYTYPYLYVNGPSGSGKTVVARDVMGAICRRSQAFAAATGPALFRSLVTIEEEDGETQVIAQYPTLNIDEIDAAYNGAKDEDLRQVFNIGYKTGTFIPRAAGKVSINYPAYCPKILSGIDNGHLPETVLNRCIRIGTHVATDEEAARLKDFFPWNVDQIATELQEEMAKWARDHAMVLREYEPDKGEFQNRQWEISRSLIQLAHACGIENRIRKALKSLFTRATAVEPIKVRMYRTILRLFDSAGGPKQDRLTSRQLLEALTKAGIPVTGNSMTGLSYMLKDDGLNVDGYSGYIAIRDPEHPAFVSMERASHRGYMRNQFDTPFARFLSTDEDE